MVQLNKDGSELKSFIVLETLSTGDMSWNVNNYIINQAKKA